MDDANARVIRSSSRRRMNKREFSARFGDRTQHALLVGLLALVTSIPPGALAQGGLPPGVRGSAAATRSVATYLDLERSLVESLRAGDRAAVLGMLADDFEVYATPEADAIPVAEWLPDELRNKRLTGVVKALSVREFDDLAVVTFVLDGRRRTKGKAAARLFYVVDIWRQSKQRLLARYLAQPSGLFRLTSKPSGRE